MSDLEWRDNSFPISLRFDDPYFSKEDGRAETSYVFIDGNQLPNRWPMMGRCVIAELGFGTGLNFLETVRQWLKFKPANAKLHFISFEQFPMTQDEMQRALSVWPELRNLAEALVAIWDTNLNIFEKAFTENVQLTVYFDDANKRLSEAEFKADAWYLDGFSPAKNPELWNADILQQVARNTVADGTFATYTAAGSVRRNLANAGFEVSKRKGFGRKRDMIVGKLSNDIDVADRH